MIQYLLKSTLRNIWKYRTQSFIGIFALAFGITCFVPVFYWLRYENSYDTFYPSSENIYRIYTENKQSGETNELVSGILDKKLSEQYAPIQASTVFFIEQNNCKCEGIPHVNLRTLFTDSTFLSVFPQEIITGNVDMPLHVTNSIVITEQTAIRLFGEVQNAIGKQIKSTHLLQQDPSYTVTAVVRDPLPNTNIEFDAILSHEQIKFHKSYIEKSGHEIWDFSALQMFAKIHPNSDMEQFEEELRTFPLKSYKNENIEVKAMPIKRIRHHLTSNIPFTLNFIRVLLVSGGLLLFSAIFNFLNLQLNLYRSRLHEFSLRSINGASQIQIKVQMIFEFTFAILVSLVLSICLMLVIRPWFSELIGLNIDIIELIKLFVYCGVGVLAITISVGAIVLLRLSSFAMRTKSEKTHIGRKRVQTVAITLQLAVSIIFIVSTLVISMQMYFVGKKDLGFSKTNIIHLSGLIPFIDQRTREALVSELSSISLIESVTDVAFTPQHGVNPFNTTTKVEWQGKRQDEMPIFNFITADSNFAETFQVKMIEGSWLKENDENKIVLNEAAVKIIGFINPIGKEVSLSLRETKTYRIVGVMRDIHTTSLRGNIYPTIFMKSAYPTNNFYVRCVSGQKKELIKRLNNNLSKIDASFINIQPEPLDDLYDRLNYSEKAGLRMFMVLGTVCLFISLFGCYAIASTSTEFRSKEIAIRKVVGAKVSEIMFLLFYEYSIQVLWASILALPIAYFAMNRWLQGYAYRINIEWWLLVSVVVIMLAMVLLTVAHKILKAANSNPAQVIKSS